MVNICLLFGIFPHSLKSEIEQKSKGAIQYAADALQKSFIAGLTEHYNNVNIVNLPFISSYPRYYKEMKAPKGFIDKVKDGVEGKSYSYINMPFVKFPSKRLSALRGLKEWGNKVNGQKVIIIYSAHSPLIKAAVKYKEQFDRGTKIILIVPDLPEFMAQKRSGYIEFLKKIDEHSLWKLYRKIDGFILLTEFMRERLPISDKPYRVIEGIFNPNDQHEAEYQTKRTIFYGGTLARRYGVMNLVNAFIKVDKHDYILEICGMGDTKEDICKIASEYPNIHYLGRLTREEVLIKQREASLLVNPRTPEGEFTRYSFPSKTMEYLASGVPTLLYKLPGIPDEYYNYCYSITDLGEDALASKIKEILDKPDNEIKELGNNAKDFILNKKNPIEQCIKLRDLISEITKDVQ